MSVKQVLIVRKDLNMRKGKIASQCAHASMKVLLDSGSVNYGEEGLGGSRPDYLVIPLNHPALRTWLEGLFTKICVYVNSEEELLALYNKAKEQNILCSLITDAGLTEFNGVPTNTVVAIGPEYSSVLDEITGHLPLL